MNHSNKSESRKQIMIIDDEVDFCLVLKAYFLRKNYLVGIAHTVADAMPNIRIERPDFVLLNSNSCKDLKKSKAEIEEAVPGVKVIIMGAGEHLNLSDF